MSMKYNPNSTYYFFNEFLEFVLELEKEYHFEIRPYDFLKGEFHICEFDFKFDSLGIKNRNELNKVLEDVLNLVTSECITKKEYQKIQYRKMFSGNWISSRTLNEKNM